MRENQDEFQELVPLLALEALTPTEGEQVRAHLQVCPPCAELYVSYRQVTDALLTSVPSQPLPEGAKDRLRARIAPPPQRWIERWQDVWFSLLHWLWGDPFRVAAAGAALVLVLGGLALLYSRIAPGLGQDPAISRILSSSARRTTSLAGTNLAPQARGQLVSEPNATEAVLQLDALNPLPADRAYQVWLLRSGQRDNGGLVTVDRNGHAVTLIHSPQPFGVYQEVGITIEPATGSPGPTTPRIIGGKLP